MESVTISTTLCFPVNFCNSPQTWMKGQKHFLCFGAIDRVFWECFINTNSALALHTAAWEIALFVKVSRLISSGWQSAESRPRQAPATSFLYFSYFSLDNFSTDYKTPYWLKSEGCKCDLWAAFDWMCDCCRGHRHFFLLVETCANHLNLIIWQTGSTSLKR